MLRVALLFLFLSILFPQRLPAAEGVRQDDDGRIVFTADDSRIVGDETNQCRWDYKPTRWGMYDVSLTYTNAGPAGSEVEIAFGAAKVAGTLATTGSPDRDATLAMGRLYVADTKPQSLVVRCPRHVDGAVQVKTVTLSPACEGQPPTQAEDGVVTLHGRDATVQGTVLRYEPAEKKQTLGYWTRPTDAAIWSFTLTQPGEFDVEVLQGCGPEQGGSVMTVAVDAGQPAVQKPLEFTVEATGGFQDFRARIIGRVGPLAAGPHTLRIVPKQIAKQAACDIRQVRLVPAKP
ncbi:MAG: hypothetical protein NTY17_05655 [Planctomycetia bacterium]|nr:hypothetical protein [Planctomycetia bacterium]